MCDTVGPRGRRVLLKEHVGGRSGEKTPLIRGKEVGEDLKFLTRKVGVNYHRGDTDTPETIDWLSFVAEWVRLAIDRLLHDDDLLIGKGERDKKGGKQEWKKRSTFWKSGDCRIGTRWWVNCRKAHPKRKITRQVGVFLKR